MMAVSTVDNSSSGYMTDAASKAKPKENSQDRFLKLLVTQLQNQDPMNPMDNAQVTSQMAQIQTVSGLETLNNTVKSLTGQFSQMQALQSIPLVGREVMVPGNRLNLASGAARGAFELDAAARAVKLEVLDAAGSVLDTVELGDRAAGRHDFSIPSDKLGGRTDLRFRITATTSSGTVGSTTMAIDKVVAINNSNSSLQFELQNLGLVDYASVRSFN